MALNRETLEILVRTHQAELVRYVRFLGAKTNDAEDIVQDAFLAAFRDGVPQTAGGRAEAAWMRGIARNLFLVHCRRVSLSKVSVNSGSIEHAEATWQQEFLRDGDGFDYVEALRDCLQNIPEKQRNALNLRYTEKQSRTEMARVLQLTEDGVKAMLRRIREALASCIRKRLNLEQS